MYGHLQLVGADKAFESTDGVCRASFSLRNWCVRSPFSWYNHFQQVQQKVSSISSEAHWTVFLKIEPKICLTNGKATVLDYWPRWTHLAIHYLDIVKILVPFKDYILTHQPIVVDCLQRSRDRFGIQNISRNPFFPNCCMSATKESLFFVKKS